MGKVLGICWRPVIVCIELNGENRRARSVGSRGTNICLDAHLFKWLIIFKLVDWRAYTAQKNALE